MKSYVVCTNQNRLIEAILMSTLNIPLLSISKKNPKLSSCASCPSVRLMLSGSIYPYLEQISMIPKVYESLRFDCTSVHWIFQDTRMSGWIYQRTAGAFVRFRGRSIIGCKAIFSWCNTVTLKYWVIRRYWWHSFYLVSVIDLMVMDSTNNKHWSISQKRFPCYRLCSHIITKTRICKYIENFTSKNWKFSDKKNWYFFHISAQNIDCGYSLEPPRRGGSNEYPQSMFFEQK